MKKNGCIACLIALCALALYLLPDALPGVFTTALAFPYEQIGALLRRLSLSGAGGNAAAIGLYICLSLLPLFFVLLAAVRRTLRAEHGLLAVMSAVLFYALYVLANPGLLSPLPQPVARAIIGGAADGCLLAFLLLRLLRTFAAGKRLLPRLRLLLSILCGVFVFAVFGPCVGALAGQIANIQAGNTAGVNGVTWVFLLLQFAMGALPYALDCIIAGKAIRMLRRQESAPYAPETLAAANALAKSCLHALTITITASALLNVVQLPFLNVLQNSAGTLSLPVSSLVYLLGVLLLCRMMADNKALKDENESFV